MFAFAYTKLTRKQGVDPRGLTFAVLDFETTGLHPNKGSRVCEVGVVRMRGDGTVLDEYSTLVNPGVRINNEEHHGITNTEVKTAPTFEQIAGDLLAFLSDAVVVSHNLPYEEKFLSAEFGRLGMDIRKVPGLCSLVLARSQLDRYGYRLENVVNLVTGEWPSAWHSALGDARSLAATLARLINEAPQQLSWAGKSPVTLPEHPRTGSIAPRAAGLRKGTEGWLATLTARLPYMTNPPAPRAEQLADYRSMLGHALSDGRVVGEEATQLAVFAARAGLTQSTARQVHEDFLTEARAQAEADGKVTAAELKELTRAGKELAASHLISDLEEAAAADKARRNGPLKGWRILPVGESERISAVMDMAASQGAAVAVNPTKTVRMVIADEVSGDDSRLAKAREQDIEVLSPDEGERKLRDVIEQSAGSLFSDSDGQQAAERLNAEQAAETQQGPPEWHQFWRRRELDGGQYYSMFLQPYERRGGTSDSEKAAAGGGGCASAAVLAGAVTLAVAEAIRQIVA
ncbi:DNA polymerase-3 subunit epsilon [Actinopolyspora lacussalsi subsp. righensis]|uniref:DNA polymerase-3 subunit epsilon n=1 Tax=Actinopolyspora righensis TaxID=995060 RepID=A0A1I7CDA9_9ACTN|nr:3'-5' exonuclease [Actinopolyspora righensis]SFT97427.1 DNA polymerase-3 subunit epsilon [Actinopolyspora righensis]